MRVEIGFDRALGGFFMNIAGAKARGEGFLYDSLTDEKLYDVGGFPRSLARYMEVLGELDMQVPKVMLEEVLQDGRQGVGNRIAVYDQAGRVIAGG